MFYFEILHLIEVFHQDKMIHVIMVFCKSYIKNSENDTDDV